MSLSDRFTPRVQLLVGLPVLALVIIAFIGSATETPVDESEQTAATASPTAVRRTPTVHPAYDAPLTATPAARATPRRAATPRAVSTARTGECPNAAERGYLGRAGALFTEISYALIDLSDFIDVPIVADAAADRLRGYAADLARLSAPSSLQAVANPIMSVVRGINAALSAYDRGDDTGAAEALVGLNGAMEKVVTAADAFYASCR